VRQSLAWAVLSGALGCSASSGTLLPAPDEVPIEVVTDDAGVTSMFVTVQLGTAPPFRALLDTGSAGLRVVAAAIADGGLSATSDAGLAVQFGDSRLHADVEGVVAYATFTIDRLTTPTPIPLMLIQPVICMLDNPSCGEVPPGGFRGANAILGVGMRTAATDQGIGNPLAQLPGHPPFAIHWPQDQGPAVLRIGASPADSLAFQTWGLPTLADGVPLLDGTPAWNDASIPVCVDDETLGVDYCAPSIWDTGSYYSYVESSAEPGGYSLELPVGTVVSVSIGPGGGLGGYRLVVGATPVPSIDEIFIESGSGFANLGLTVFRHYDALFDQWRGVVGLAQH
jgi:hypothetical protein